MQFIYSILIEMLWWLALPFLIFNGRFRKVFRARLHQKLAFELAIENQKRDNPVAWFHCASLGEFEQARPVIESYRAQHPHHFIALTFFSDSGYDHKKNYSHANWIGYLPFDRYFQIKKFIQALNPSIAFFVKYEVWPNVFFELKKSNTPIHLFSARFHEKQRFFGVFSCFWKPVLSCVSQFYVQENQSEQTLRMHGFENVLVSGDTRFDRVLEIARQDFPKIQERIQSWSAGSKILVLGSSYETEERMALAWLKSNQEWKIIVVPHEVTTQRISEVQEIFHACNTELWSSQELDQKSQVLLVDSVGLLSRLYAAADMVVIGGGFNKGIHNTLEAAVYNTPLCFGKIHTQFQEAIDLLHLGAAFTFSNQQEFNSCLSEMQLKIQDSGGSQFVESNAGATLKILNKALSKN